MLAHEDVIAMVILFNTAKSYKFVGKYGILHIRRSNSACKITDSFSMTVNRLYFLDVAIDFMKKTEDPGLEIRDPKLPAVRAGQTGNIMEARRRGAPLPGDLPDSLARQGAS